MKHRLSILVAGLICSNLLAQSTHSPLRKGDRAYDREQYKAAEKQYRIAADRDINNPQALYNLGNTLFQQGDFEGAQKRFKLAAEEATKTNEKADALHNLGDAFLKQRKYKEAVQAYEQSLRLRPADEGSKQNLQMAKKRLREEEKKEKEKQQQKQQQQQQDQQKQDQQNQPNQPQNPQNQPNQPQNQPNPPAPNPEDQPQSSQPEQKQKQEEQRLKKEDAKRLLETAIGPDDRKNAKKYRAAQQQSKPKGPRKDW